jgi:glycosyltransferase involved in cell wall biosynthesis
MTSPDSPAPEPRRGVLFVSYDGVLGGPGRSQVLPYLRVYADAGWETALVSFEKPDLLADAGRLASVEKELRAAGIAWRRLPWRRAMVRDLLAGLRAVREETRSRRPHVLHARSYVPALLGLRAAVPEGARLLFDMRGFWPDERVDGGLWSRRHPLFLLWKRIEKTLLRRADAVVVLAQAGVDVLLADGLLPPDTPRAVIPCGADLERFRPAPAGELPPPLEPFRGKRIWTFLGATGTWYLLDAMLDFAADAVAADPDSRILFLTEDPAGRIAEGLASRGVPRERILITRAPHAEVPAWITPSHAGVFFIRSCRSKKASCPTKLGEFLACGVPVVINEGVGDTASIVRGAQAGVVVDSMDSDGYARARRELATLRADSALAGRCRTEAEARFDARKGGEAFLALAESLARGGAVRR